MTMLHNHNINQVFDLSTFIIIINSEKTGNSKGSCNCDLRIKVLESVHGRNIPLWKHMAEAENVFSSLHPPSQNNFLQEGTHGINPNIENVQKYVFACMFACTVSTERDIHYFMFMFILILISNTLSICKKKKMWIWNCESVREKCGGRCVSGWVQSIVPSCKWMWQILTQESTCTEHSLEASRATCHTDLWLKHSISKQTPGDNAHVREHRQSEYMRMKP